MAQGRITPAAVVDHIKPHRGDTRVFWDKANWQSLCLNCHNSTKQSEERVTDAGCDVNGMPLDPTHFWHQGG